MWHVLILLLAAVLMQIQFGRHSYQARALSLSAQRLVNYYPEQAPQDAKDPLVLYNAPGIKSFADRVGTGPIRGMEVMDGTLYVVSGCELYKVTKEGRGIALGNICIGTAFGLGGQTREAQAEFTITAGSEGSGNSITSITVDGEEILSDSVDFDDDASTTALAFSRSTGTRIALLNSFGDDLETYEFDGTDWTQVGTGLEISDSTVFTICGLSSTRVALFDAENDELKTYDFDGTNWSQVGNGFSISPGGDAALATLSSTRVAFLHTFTNELETYDFDGTDWSLVGSSFSVTVSSGARIDALSSSQVALVDNGSNVLRVYSFDGSNWSLVGGSSVSNVDPDIAALSSTRIAFIDTLNDELRTYDFNGSTWSQTGNGLSISGLTPVVRLTALSSSRIAFASTQKSEIRTYEFDGTDWAQVGNSLSVSMTNKPDIGAMLGSGVSTSIYSISADDDTVIITGGFQNGLEVVITTSGDVQVQPSTTTMEGAYKMPGAWSGSQDTTGGFGNCLSMAHNAADPAQLCIVDGHNGWIYDETNGLQQITDSDFFASHVVEFQDQYFAFIRKDTGQWFLSNLNDGLTYTATDIATAEGDPDDLVTLISNHREMWLFGENTTEVWYNSGASDFPFDRLGGVFIERGCAAACAVAEDDNTVFWLGDDLIIYRADGYTPQRISTHAIEEAIRKYETVGDAIAFVYTISGHKFLVFIFPSGPATWVYDISTGLWHERESYGLKRWRANKYATAYGKHLVGDYEKGRVGELDPDTFQEWGEVLQGQITGPPVFSDKKRIFHRKFELEVEAGVGLTSGQGSNPQIWLDWSDDGGRTFGPRQLYRSMGKIGAYRQRLRWMALGQSRDRVYRATISDPVKRSFISAHLDAELGEH